MTASPTRARSRSHRHPTLARRRGARGLGLVELMVGMAIGLLVLAASLAVATRQVAEQRRLIAEARLQQDLRVAVDLVTRGLRRAAYWTPLQDGPRPVYVTNPAQRFAIAAGPTLAFAHSQGDRRTDDVADYGVRLRSGVLQLRVADGGWQALTDPNLLRVDALSLQPSTESLALELVCSDDDCRPGSPRCARVLRRAVDLRLSASSPRDASLQRTLETRIALRNDALEERPC